MLANLSTSTSDTQDRIDQTLGYGKTLDESLAKYRATGDMEPEQAEMLDSIAAQITVFNTVRDEQLLPAARRSDGPAFEKAFMTTAAPAATGLLGTLEKLVKHEVDGAALAAKESAETYRSSRNSMLICLVAGFLVAITLAWFVVRRITGSLAEVGATLKRVAPTGSRVLISGPPGVGKEIAARMIHQWSPRAKAPFIVLSAAMMSPERVEEELFGSEADGVVRPGLLEHAHGGTLFLDEIADMPLTTQAKILRVLTDQSYNRVGGQRPVKVDVRVLSATSRNLQDEISAGRFREDLYYRLNVVPVRLPPLRERREDIPELVSHFLARFAAERRMPLLRISEEAMAALQAHEWPGNVRQLRNIIERTIILAPGDRVSCIDVDLLPPEILDNQSAMGGSTTAMAIMGSPLREARESFEREYLKIQIRRFSGNISRTASFIGMERSALHRKLKALGIGDKREGDEA
jgi:transcriptional regulator of acetoin/glycerol metabolism